MLPPYKKTMMPAAENQIVVYRPNEAVRLAMRLENEMVWLTQSKMATLFGCSSDNILEFTYFLDAEVRHTPENKG